MRRVSSLSILIALLAVAGCATAPSPRPDGRGVVQQSLALCRAGAISNRPATDSHGRISGYSPALTLRGVDVARAPVDGCLSSGYGPRVTGGVGRFHHGVDIYTGSPAPIRAAAAGRVVEIGEQRGYGLTVVLRHANGVTTRYAHLSRFTPGLKKDSRLSAGETLGLTGRTGNATAVHLHYEIRIDGRPVDPLG